MAGNPEFWSLFSGGHEDGHEIFEGFPHIVGIPSLSLGQEPGLADQMALFTDLALPVRGQAPGVENGGVCLSRRRPFPCCTQFYMCL